MFQGFQAKPRAGIDLGSYSVKVLVAQPGVGGLRVLSGEASYGGDTVTPEQRRPPETIARAVQAAFAAAGTTPRACGTLSLGISGPDVILKQITLPLLDDAEVGPALRFEARKHLPFDPQQMVLDFQILGRFPTERKVEIMLAAVTREHVEEHVRPLRLLGLEPDIIDAAPLALANALLHGDEGGSGAQVLLDIGEVASHLVLVQRGQPFFSRRIPFGGFHLTQAIAGGMAIPVAEAEEWKLAIGADRPGLRVDWQGRELSAVSDALRRTLLDEIVRSFAFYRTQAQLADVGRMVLSGGSARLPGLADRLGEMLGTPVSVFAPSTGPGRDAELRLPHFAQAFGLALRSS